MNRPLRILQFICPTGFYGAERWVLALAKHLDPKQVECELAITLEPGYANMEISKEFRLLGLPEAELAMKHKFDFSVVNKLAALIKERNIDIVHTHGYKSDILGLWAARKAGVRCVVTPHGFENAKDIKLRTFIWLGCQAMKRADAIAPLSPQLMEDMKRLGVAEQKVTYIQNGVDLSEVEATPAPTNKSNTKRIGFIGQLISRKNLFDMLDVFEMLYQKHPDCELLLVGDGEQADELKAHAQQLSSNTQIQFLGFRDDRLALLKSFDLFAMTSTLEGIPRCLMEATAAGVPVAAYDIAGVDQLIHHQKTGLLAPLGDKAQLFAHWQSLLFDEVKATKIKQNAKDYVYQAYSAQRMAAEYTTLFNKLDS